MKLTNEQLEIISGAVARTMMEQIEKDKTSKRDRRYQNTLLLLKSYRGMVAHCENITGELLEIDNKSIQDLDLDEINLESIESIKRSRTKTIAMVMFIQSRVRAYKSMCTDEEMVKYRLLEKKYLQTIKLSNRQIIESESIDKSTFYRQLNKATEELGVLFFGVDALNLSCT